MRFLLFVLLFLPSVSWSQAVDIPYNPDANSDSLIGAPDLLDLLTHFGEYFELDTPNFLGIKLRDLPEALPVLLSDSLAKIHHQIQSLDSLIQGPATWQTPCPSDTFNAYCEGTIYSLSLLHPTEPAPFENGETCDGRDPEVIRFFNFPNGESFTIANPESGFIDIASDSTFHLHFEVTDGNGGGFIWDADYSGNHTWPEWMTLPGQHNYKKDCSDVFPGTRPWHNWLYFLMVPGGTLSGTGRFSGTEFTMQHQPMNAYYGLEVGYGGNNKNENLGGNAWFFYSGPLVVDGVSEGLLSSSGSLFFDLIQN